MTHTTSQHRTGRRCSLSMGARLLEGRRWMVRQALHVTSPRVEVTRAHVSLHGLPHLITAVIVSKRSPVLLYYNICHGILCQRPPKGVIFHFHVMLPQNAVRVAYLEAPAEGACIRGCHNVCLVFFKPTAELTPSYIAGIWLHASVLAVCYAGSVWCVSL
jgi:hypothetical protein